ncbi:MAG: Modification methylase [Rhodospirillaceae bacterium]|nr:MAG: Modification methylase [Rhodospirillaceae bacterium]TNC97366.1 MAG: Modification methylase NspV [Stygiobacter sp.]
MAEHKDRDVLQYGDFQTPPELASEVCTLLARLGVNAPAILEPTCGRGAFLAAAIDAFPSARIILGVEINADYVSEAQKRVGPWAQLEQGDFFLTDWAGVLGRDCGPWLILGNPPWVTNAALGVLKSANLPTKSNFQRLQGLEAITGKANFDISEWMLLRQLDWLKKSSGWIAMLVKTSVARKVLRQAWRQCDPVGRAAIYKVDAMFHFGASVDACLFVLPVNVGRTSFECDVFDALKADSPSGAIGFHDDMLVSDVASFFRHRHLVGHNDDYVWRSGVKHDCSKVMELVKGADGRVLNGLKERVEIEHTFVFPMLKSSDVARGRVRNDRFMIVTQKEVGEDTAGVALCAPSTWRYLIEHGQFLDARGSIIYKNKPRFSIFGVGAYSFAPWKVAISGFYKELNFMKVGPVGGKPVILDDTIYFISCRTEDEADFVLSLVRSPPYLELISAMIFNDDKRSITADLLKRISLKLVAEELRLSDRYSSYAKQGETGQFSLALGA